jgi:Domain of unknown function (DUF222)/HNH endonuclease
MLRPGMRLVGLSTGLESRVAVEHVSGYAGFMTIPGDGLGGSGEGGDMAAAESRLHQAGAFVRELISRPGYAYSTPELMENLRELHRLLGAANVLWLQFIAELDTRPDAITGTGRAGTARVFLTEALNLSRGQANRDLAAADAIASPHPQLASMGQALTRGQVSREHLDVAVSALRRIPKHLKTKPIPPDPDGPPNTITPNTITPDTSTPNTDTGTPNTGTPNTGTGGTGDTDTGTGDTGTGDTGTGDTGTGGPDTGGTAAPGGGGDGAASRWRTGAEVIDEVLTGQARWAPPAAIGRLADDILHRLDPDRADRFDPHAYERRSCSITTDSCGMGIYHIILDAATHLLVSSALTTNAAPRPDGRAVTNHGQPVLVHDERTHSQRLADAAADLILTGATRTHPHPSPTTSKQTGTHQKDAHQTSADRRNAPRTSIPPTTHHTPDTDPTNTTPPAQSDTGHTAPGPSAPANNHTQQPPTDNQPTNDQPANDQPTNDQPANNRPANDRDYGQETDAGPAATPTPPPADSAAAPADSVARPADSAAAPADSAAPPADSVADLTPAAAAGSGFWGQPAAMVEINVIATVDQVAAAFGATDPAARTAGLARLALAGTLGRYPGANIHPDVLARLACDTPWRRILTDHHGAVLHEGRAKRLATPAQKRALTIRDGGCVIPGCDASPEWCDVHHIIPWQHGGTTDLDTMALLCRRHHTALHTRTYEIQIRHGIPWVKTPAWRHPHQPWQHNLTHTHPHLAATTATTLTQGEPWNRPSHAA